MADRGFTQIGAPMAILVAALALNLFTAVMVAQRPPSEGVALSDAECREMLADALARSTTGGTFDVVEGVVIRGALERRLFARGILDDSDGTVVATHILKVGWPFTTLRGFIYVIGEEQVTLGAAAIDGDVRAGFARFVPLQPVWPGLVINTLILAVSVGLVARVLQMLLPRRTPSP